MVAIKSEYQYTNVVACSITVQPHRVALDSLSYLSAVKAMITVGYTQKLSWKWYMRMHWKCQHNITQNSFRGTITVLVVATAERCNHCSICESLAANLSLNSVWFITFCFLYFQSSIWFQLGSQLFLRALCYDNKRRIYSFLPKHQKLCIVL